VRLQTRLTISSAVLITGVSLAIGSAVSFSAYNHEISTASNQLVNDSRQIKAAKGQELSTALLLSYQQDMTIGLLDSTKHLTEIKSGSIPLVGKSVQKILNAAADNPVLRQTPTGAPYLLEAVSLAGGEWVLLQQTVADAQSRLSSSLASLVLFTASADLVAVLLVWLMIRRDLWQIRRLIGAAKRIANGGEATFPDGKGTTEVLQLSTALKSMVLQLQANEVEMQRFLGDASHELRTPLTVIRGYLEMLGKTAGGGGGGGAASAPSAEFTARAVGKMSAEVSRMQQLIEDLLLLAELGAAGRPLELSRVDLIAVITTETESLHDLQPGRELTLNLPESAQLDADLALLSQLFGNLFSNIRRHTSSATPVEVSVTGADDGWQILVDDGGPGLTDDAYAKGVGHFERFDPSRSRDNGGSGLGMSIMAGIVNRHHGSLKLERSPLGGLRTRIWLPAL